MIVKMFQPHRFVIYAITNDLNGHRYIGLSGDYRKRWSDHLRLFPTGGTVLYRAMQKHGYENFRFEIIRYGLTLEEAKKAEIDAIEFLGTYRDGYNATKGGDACIGLLYTEERRQKLRIAQTGRKMPEAAVEKLRNRVITTATRAKMRENAKQRTGWRHSDGAKASIGKKHKGKTVSKETRKKMASAKMGARLDQDHREKIGAASRQMWATRREEILQARSNARNPKTSP